MNMNEFLSQEEIDALLRGESYPTSHDEYLSPEEIDALGEIGNISMGTAATTLFTLLNKRVTITTPEVSITNIHELAMQYPIPFVGVEIQYTEGLEGINLLIIHENDVKVLTDLMMGGDGSQTNVELSDLHLSAIGEIMNQMIGSACTSLASMFNKSINISPPNAFIIDFSNENPYDLFQSDEPIVKVNFKIEITGVMESYIMQLLPIDFAKGMVNNLLHSNSGDMGQVNPIQSQEQAISRSQPPVRTQNESREQNGINHSSAKAMKFQSPQVEKKQVDVRPVHFQRLEERNNEGGRENIDLLLDVPLQITVELGKTKKMIREILEINSGSVIELDKVAGEPVDILVNGKMIAKGEVVVIDDSFGVRIIDILSPTKRLSQLK